MSAKLQLVFQSKGKDGNVECTAEKVLLHPSDMKSLRLPLGSYVFISTSRTVTISQTPNSNEETVVEDSEHSDLMCQIWPSKAAVKGVVTINKIWSPNFTAKDSNRVVYITPDINRSVYFYVL